MSDNQPGEDVQSSVVAGEANERLVIELAICVLEGKGYVEEPDDELIYALRRLYHANPICQVKVKFNGEVLHDLCAGRPGEYLAGAWEREREEHWERHEAQRWSCPCGVTFGLYLFNSRDAHFYTLTTDGLFHTQVSNCPGCARDLKRVRAQHGDGQLGLF